MYYQQGAPLISRDFSSFEELNLRIAQNELCSIFFEQPTELRHANQSSAQTKASAIFTDWLNKIKRGQSKSASKAIYEKHMSWQKGAIKQINYDKAILEHLFNETLLKSNPNERKLFLTKADLSRQGAAKKESFFQNLPHKLKAIGEIITSEQFLRDGLVIVSVSFFMGSIFYLLISQVASPAITLVSAAVGTHLPQVMNITAAVYCWRWPIIISRFVITHAVNNESRVKRWIIVPANLFLDCTLFVRMQMTRKSCLYTYSLVKFANPNLASFESKTVKRFRELPWVDFFITQVKKRNTQALKDAVKEKLRRISIDYQLGEDLVQLRSEWISNAIG